MPTGTHWPGQPGPWPDAAHGGNRLATQAEALDELLVAGEVRVAQVIEQAAALADHQDQPTPRVMVALVGLEMTGQVLNPLGEQGHLDLDGPGVFLVLLILLLDLLFD